MSWFVTPLYVSSAEMQLSPAGPNFAERVISMEQDVLSRTSLSVIIQDPRLGLYKRERARLPLEDVIQQMRTQDIGIRIMPQGKENLRFRISFSYPDPEKARATVQALLLRFADANADTRAQTDQQRERSHREVGDLEARIAGIEKRLGIASPHLVQSDELTLELAGKNLDVLDVPSLPMRPAKPNRAIFAAIGFGAGFVAAVVIAVFRRRPPAIPFPAQAA